MAVDLNRCTLDNFSGGRKNMESALSKQEGGTHYKDMGVQPWIAMDAWLTKEQNLGYLLGTAIAYLARYNAEGVGKGGITDVKKAVHVLQRMIEVHDGSDA